MSDIERVLTYWLSPEPTTEPEVEARKQFWFGGSEGVDREIAAQFGDLVERAHTGGLDDWTASPRGTLALIILVDQFSRNVYRGTPRAFARDAMALELATAGFANRSNRFAELDTIERFFAAMPFRHAEEIEAQTRGVAVAVHDALAAPPHLRQLAIYSVDWARKHLDVIVRFGRFPHRNAVCGRTSTTAELEYLAYLKLAGQWL